MMHRARIALALSIAAASSLAACSDSTGPQPPHFAQYLDSLYFATLSDSTLSENVRDSRESAISLFEVGAAFGVPPKTITMLTATGTEQWTAYEYVSVQSHLQGDYINLLIATRDLRFRTYMIVEYASDGSMVVAVLNDNDTVRTGATRHDGTSIVSLDGSHTCPTPVSLNNPTIFLGNCTTNSFSSSGSIDFNDTPGLEPAYTHLSFPLTNFEGERFFD